MKKVSLKFLFVLSIVLVVSSAATAQKILPLYPAGASESNGLTETVREDGGFSNSSTAEMHIYTVNGSTPSTCVVICPGGGYSNLAFQHEGRDVALWLNEIGISAVVLKYRMPNGNYEIPGKDVRTCFEYVRDNAVSLNIDPSKVGVMGFSAGGHLASTAATQFTNPKNRPDFAVLVYPVITMEKLTHGGSRKNLLGENPGKELIERFSNHKQVTPRTPPCFIAYSSDDQTVDPRNGTAFYDSLCDKGVPAELHIYSTGGHGWGWRENFAYRSEFLTSLRRWLTAL